LAGQRSAWTRRRRVSRFLGRWKLFPAVEQRLALVLEPRQFKPRQFKPLQFKSLQFKSI
jgi:hypothetical protein